MENNYVEIYGGKMYGFIYITTNRINGKRYIGQRKYDRTGKWKDYLGSGIYLKNAINKYGKENFTKEIIEECETKDKLNEQEKYWISFYDAVNNENFYNISNGGDGGNTIIGYSKEQLEEYKQRKSILHKQTALKGENAPRSKLTKKEVKEIINRLLKNDFNQDIANDYNISPGTVDDIRHHKTWVSLTKDIKFDDISTRKRPRNSKPIIQYDLFGNFIKRWDNARKIQNELGISYKQISQVCNGNKRICHNFVWRFETDSFDKYPVDKKKWHLYMYGY